MHFLKEVIKDLAPTKDERSKINEIFLKIKKSIRIKNTKIELGGSAQKDTWLKGNHDIDIYVKFRLKDYHNKNISELLFKELKRHFRASLLHGSRDYYQVIAENYTVELIPIMDISRPSEALNLTDISPFHCMYVKKHKKSNEIRLAKAFCRASKCYGAESYIGGFSGYVLEILVIHYSNFLSLVRHASKWKERTFIGSKNLIERLNVSKKLGPLILMDPVDSNRNAAAALSYEKYCLFIHFCRSFLKNPSRHFFVEKKFDESLLIKKHKNRKIIILEVTPLPGKIDIIGAKLLKCFNYIKSRFSLADFKLVDSAWNWEGMACFYFVFEKTDLSKTMKHYGPPAANKPAVNAFVKKWGRSKLNKEGNHIYVDVKREFTRPEDYISNLLRKDKNLLNYAKSFNLRK